MMLALSPACLTFILIWASGISILLLRYISFIASYSARRECREPLRGSSPISGLRSLLDGALFVGEDAHKVREARDVEDLHVMLAEVAGKQALVRSARPGQQSDDQGYTGRVDVIDLLEVEQDGSGSLLSASEYAASRASWAKPFISPLRSRMARPRSRRTSASR